jgi:hypothetical protein
VVEIDGGAAPKLSAEPVGYWHLPGQASIALATGY